MLSDNFFVPELTEVTEQFDRETADVLKEAICYAEIMGYDLSPEEEQLHNLMVRQMEVNAICSIHQTARLIEQTADQMEQAYADAA